MAWRRAAETLVIYWHACRSAGHLLLLALVGLCLSAGPADAAPRDAGLLGTLIGRPFVVPDAQGKPVPFRFVQVEPNIIETRIADQTVERYRLEANGRGTQINPSVPDIISSVRFDDARWILTYRGMETAYSLDTTGDLVGHRSGDVSDWLRRRFVVALNPDQPELDRRLAERLHAIHEEAERFEGHDHGDERHD